MDRISGLSDELLVKILSFVPTKVAVSTSILSKRWEFLWMWVPKLEFVMNHYGSDLPLGDFINKNLPLLRAPVIESFRLQCFSKSFQPEDINRWVGITISRCIRELDISYFSFTHKEELAVLVPSSLYTCKSLATLKLSGHRILVDVPPTVSLPSLKTLVLKRVTYSNADSLRLLLSYCPVLEDLVIYNESEDNLRGIVVISPSLQRLTLPIGGGFVSSSSGEYVIVTPSLKYFKVDHYTQRFSYLVGHMPKLEEADIIAEEHLEKIFELITSVKRLSLWVWINDEEKYMYHDGIFFSQLEHLKLCISFDYWSKLLFRLLQDSPKLRVLKLYVDCDRHFNKYEAGSWNHNQSSVPKCLLESLETLEFEGYRGRPEERDFLSFIFKNACRLKSSSITPPRYGCVETSSSTSSTET